jgi:hypothetical protein
LQDNPGLMVADPQLSSVMARTVSRERTSNGTEIEIDADGIGTLFWIEE